MGNYFILLIHFFVVVPVNILVGHWPDPTTTTLIYKAHLTQNKLIQSAVHSV